MYKDYIEYTEKNNYGLSRYTFFDAFEAEKVHKKLIQEAKNEIENNNYINISSYYTCTSYGYTFKEENHPKRCPICGAPNDKISIVE